MEPWWSLGVALGWLWGAYAVPINRPWGGLGVALGGFAQPPFWFQLSAFSISAFAEMWLWVAPPGLSMLEVGCLMLDVRALRPNRSQDQTGLNAETQRNAEKRRENEVSADLVGTVGPNERAVLENALTD